MLTIAQFGAFFMKLFQSSVVIWSALQYFQLSWCYIPLNNISLMDYIFIGGHWGQV